MSIFSELIKKYISDFSSFENIKNFLNGISENRAINYLQRTFSTTGPFVIFFKIEGTTIAKIFYDSENKTECIKYFFYDENGNCETKIIKEKI